MSLSGMRVVVTRAAESGGALASLLADLGAVVISVPTIRIVPPLDSGPLVAALQQLRDGGFSWVAFTSANGVEGLIGAGDDAVEVLKGVRIAAVGSATKTKLGALGLGVDVMPESYTAGSLALALGPGSGSILLPRAEEVPATMADALRANGWSPVEVVAYRTLPAEGGSPEARRIVARDFDVVTFTSASTVRGFAGMFGTDVLQDKVVACIGPVTAGAAEDLAIVVDVVASEHTVHGLVDALVDTVGR